MTFLSARSHARPRALLIGVPFDATSTFRGGSRHAPQAIRWASQSIETYSPVLRRDLGDIALTDAGDLDVGDVTAEAMVDAVAARVAAVPEGTLPVLLGGEHTLTLGALRGLAARHPDLMVLQLDAHADLREAYEGRRVSHATVMRRIMDLLPADAVVAAGLRAGTREEFALAETMRHRSRDLAIPPDVWGEMRRRAVYVTIDIDALDPADAPGTGNPEPEGIASGDLLAFVRRLGDVRVVGLDLVEVSPPLDPSGRTSVLAATILRETILAITPPRPA